MYSEWCGDETMTYFMLPCNKEKLNTGIKDIKGFIFKPYI